MTRILPITLVVALLVGGGFWLASQGQAAPPETPATAPADAPADADGDAAAALPEGYRPLEPVVDERVTSFEAPEQVLEPGLDYVAAIDTTAGTITVDLFEERTPVTVNNFVFLALHRYYDGIVFHRVLEDFMAQTGDPTGTGSGGPGYEFEDEIVEGLSHDQRGTLSMANAGPGTNGSQFFLTFAPTPWLDGRHTVFGRMIEGDAVLDELTRIDPSQPSAIAHLDEPVSAALEQGVALPGDPERTVEALLEEELGAVPAVGQSFSLGGGVTGVVGRVGERPAAGFFPAPDAIERLVIGVRDADAPEPGTEPEGGPS